MSDDDDLPVLTHVLRTGSARTAPPSIGDDDLDDVFGADPRPRAGPDAPFEQSIIIGHDADEPFEAHHPIALALAQTARGDAPPPDAIVADPRQMLGHDPFRLAQDVDEATPASPAPIGATEPVEPMHEPHLVPAAGDGHGKSIALDTPFDFSAPPDTTALARSIRQAVLDDLAARIDTELDARIAQAMRTEVETALSQLQGNLRAQLTEALRDVVARAVDEEIARMTWSSATGLPH